MPSFFKKKPDESPRDASVSSIPVPPADSALVIDLPEGQKLVLGKMEEGTVIEVATWRGTGRPDSRTNRLMLGVSVGGSNSEESEKKEEEPEVRNSVMHIIQKVAKAILTLVSVVSVRVIHFVKSSWNRVRELRQRSKRGEISHHSPKPEMESDDLDITAWLEGLRSHSRLKELENSTHEVPQPTKRHRPKSSKNMKPQRKEIQRVKKPAASSRSPRPRKSK